MRGFLDRKHGLDEKEEKNCNVREYFIFGDFLILWLQVEDGVSFLVPVLDIFDWTPVFKR